uniref:Uncharacterized protein n=1 Tax=Magnetococcus massalia (strain MO-1) TaxID=451514 RepID=A0A1S7LN74_MAGMO|nr:Protein of unknown function [Candidatus Magnetococcus massalia]
MDILNFLLIGALAWVTLKAIIAGVQKGHSERYFKREKLSTGNKYHNFFGIPNVGGEERFQTKPKQSE